MSSDATYDVFLSHADRDKPARSDAGIDSRPTAADRGKPAATRFQLSPAAASWNRFAADRHRSRQAGIDTLPMAPGRCKLNRLAAD
jgi:hypothetical protein